MNLEQAINHKGSASLRLRRVDFGSWSWIDLQSFSFTADHLPTEALFPPVGGVVHLCAAAGRQLVKQFNSNIFDMSAGSASRGMEFQTYGPSIVGLGQHEAPIHMIKFVLAIPFVGS